MFLLTTTSCTRHLLVQVGKEEVELIVCICVWIAFRRIRQLSKHYRAPPAIEDEPSPPPLCGQAPEAENLNLNSLFVQC